MAILSLNNRRTVLLLPESSDEDPCRLRDFLHVFAANADDPDAKRALSRVADLITPDRMQFQPPVPAKSYLDGFGNYERIVLLHR